MDFNYTPKGPNVDENMSEEDKGIIAMLKKQFSYYQQAGDTEGMKRTNDQANEIRKKYGYTGGTDGSEYIVYTPPKVSDNMVNTGNKDVTNTDDKSALGFMQGMQMYDDNKSLYNQVYGDLVNVDPYEKNYAKNIKDMFQIQWGSDKANKAVSESAAGNAGNIDSAALAYAQRAQEAYDRSAAEYIQNMYDLQANKGIGLYGQWQQGASGALGHTQANIDSDRAHAYNMDSLDTARYGYDKSFDSTVYQTDSQERMAYALNDLNLKIAQINADVTMDTAQKQKETAIAVQQIASQHGLSIAQVQAAAAGANSNTNPSAKSITDPVTKPNVAMSNIIQRNTATNAGGDSVVDHKKVEADVYAILASDQFSDEYKRQLITEARLLGYNNVSADMPAPSSSAGNPLYTNSNPTPAGDDSVKVVYLPTINTGKASAYGVDKHGLKLIEKLKSEAANKGGFLTEKEIYEFAVATSDENNTNKNQIGKVFNFLGVDTALLDRVKDAGIFPFNWDWGVKVK